MIPRTRLHLAAVIVLLPLAGGCKRGRASVGGPGRSHERTWGGTAASCTGLPATCGPSGNEDCCKSLRIPGGTFYRSYDGVDYLDQGYPATVSDFYLDKYEVTVGRFRKFVNAGMGTQASPPREGAGAHPKIAGSGWRSAWNGKLAADSAALAAASKCYASYQTWTDTVESNESKPQNCLDWYTAFAFCVWDGGRLATEAEWNYAASGGNEQRYYPWSRPPSSRAIDESYAAYCGGACRSLLNVGAKSPKGDGKWGQSDLGGNAWEWTLDWSSSAFPMPCHDCAVVEGGTYRNFRSGAFDDLASTLRSACRHVYLPEYHGIVGARCARSP
jgi:formylglycine-generating enzyme